MRALTEDEEHFVKQKFRLLLLQFSANQIIRKRASVRNYHIKSINECLNSSSRKYAAKNEYLEAKIEHRFRYLVDHSNVRLFKLAA